MLFLFPYPFNTNRTNKQTNTHTHTHTQQSSFNNIGFFGPLKIGSCQDFFFPPKSLDGALGLDKILRKNK